MTEVFSQDEITSLAYSQLVQQESRLSRWL